MKETTLLMWDEKFPSLLLKGEGTAAFLHGQTTADIFTQKQLEKIFLSCWLSNRGSLKALLEIRILNSVAEIVILGGEINSIINGFESVIFPADKVKVEVIKPIRRIQKVNNFKSWKDSTPSWIDKSNLISEEIANHKKTARIDLETWKIRQGIPTFGREINGETNPYELGLGDIINLDKGCYLGQEAMARFFRSKSFKYQLRYWKSYEKSNGFEIGSNLFNTNKDEGLKKKVGFITSLIKVDENLFKGLALIKTNFIDNSCFSGDGTSIIIKRPISFSQTC